MENTGIIDIRLTHGETECAKMNINKYVNVNLISSGIKTLYILGATKYMGTFCYVMHTAKRPRKPYIHDDIAMHVNIRAGYYIVDPVRIIL